ncbi:MAG: hypothetical protein OEV93_02305 [Candidatus Moranbacteria bacterium]|nr:hypothetical protein [Candidatus Moranbacteria bacterium]
MKEQSNTLRHLVTCSLCGEKYHHDRTIVLEENDLNATFHLTCHKCNTSVLIFVSNNQQNIISLGIATDMNGDEVVDFFKGGAITTDDVLSVYEKISKI